MQIRLARHGRPWLLRFETGAFESWDILGGGRTAVGLSGLIVGLLATAAVERIGLIKCPGVSLEG